MNNSHGVPRPELRQESLLVIVRTQYTAKSTPKSRNCPNRIYETEITAEARPIRPTVALVRDGITIKLSRASRQLCISLNTMSIMQVGFPRHSLVLADTFGRLIDKNHGRNPRTLLNAVPIDFISAASCLWFHTLTRISGFDKYVGRTQEIRYLIFSFNPLRVLKLINSIISCRA